MSPWVIFAAALILGGGGGSKKKSGGGGAGGGGGAAEEVPDEEEGGLNPQAQCPEGSPVLYDGVPVYGDIRSSDELLTFPEQEALEDVLTDIVSDKGYPQPGPGLCTFELLTKAMGVNTWRGVLTMLIMWRANPYTKGKSYAKLNQAQRERYNLIAEAVIRHEEPSSDEDDAAENNPGEGPGETKLLTATPTVGAYYRVKPGDSVLKMAGAASGFAAGSPKRLAYAKKVNTDPLNMHVMQVAMLGSFDMKYLGGYTAQLVPSYDPNDYQAKPGSGNAFPVLYFPPVGP